MFVTAHTEHAVDAFDLHAVDYLLKPVREPTGCTRPSGGCGRAEERRPARTPSRSSSVG